MEYLLKLTPFGRNGKDNFTQANTVGSPIRPENLGTKGVHDRASHCVVGCEQLMRATIGIKEFGWQMAAQRYGETRFPRGYTSRNAERWHRIPVTSA
jgi:hypothetical protein